MDGERKSRGRDTLTHVPLLSTLAGAIAGTVTNPLDVVRTQATMRTWAVDSASTSLSLLPRIFAEQGVRGLMAGTLARASYMGPFPPPLHPLSPTLSLHPLF